MVRRTATLGLVAIFLATMLCAIICPGAETQASTHVCDKPDHSCCPQSHGNSPQFRCVETHFLGASKDHHVSPELAVVVVLDSTAIAMPNLVRADVVLFQQLPSPPQDLLAKHHIFRI